MGTGRMAGDEGITWLDNDLDEDFRYLVEGYLLRDTYRDGLEPDLDDINDWLSSYDDVDENWGRPDMVNLRLRMAKAREVDLGSDNIYMTVGLQSPYVVFVSPEVEDDEYYLLRTDRGSNKVGIETGGLPEAVLTGSIGENFLESGLH